MSSSSYISALESLLFVSGEPTTFSRLGKILGLSLEEIGTLIEALGKKYEADASSGLMLVCDDTTVMLATESDNASYVEALTKSTLQENLSKAALEVLAIIAYRAPVSRSEVDAIRGVNCSFTLRNLLLRDLISREGNPSDSRGYLYRPTLRFLRFLGIGQVSDLPDFTTLSEDERLRMILEEEGTATNELAADAKLSEQSLP